MNSKLCANEMYVGPDYYHPIFAPVLSLAQDMPPHTNHDCSRRADGASGAALKS